MLRLALVLGIAALSLSAFSSVVSRWQVTVGGAAPGFDPRGKVVAMPNGDTYALSETDLGTSAQRDVRVTKYNLSGVKQWDYVLPDVAQRDDLAGQIVAQGSDVVFSAIRARTAIANDGLVVRLSPAGAVVWTANLGDASAAKVLRPTTSGYLYVGMNVPGPLGSDIVAVAQLDQAGATLWKELYAASLALVNDLAVISESSESVILGGAAGGRPFVVAYSKSGEELWHDPQAGPQGEVVGIQVHGQTALVQISESGSVENGVLKYTLAGARLWSSWLTFQNELDFADAAKVGTFSYVLSKVDGLSASWMLRRYRTTSSYPAVLGPYAGVGARSPYNLAVDGNGLVIGGRTNFNGGMRPTAARIDLDTLAEQWVFIGTSSSTRSAVVTAPNGDVLLSTRNSSGDHHLERLEQRVAIVNATLSKGSGNAAVPPTLTVTLEAKAPTGGISVALQSTNAALGVPATAFVSAGQTSTSVSLTAKPVSVNTAVTIKATSNGVTKQASYTALPPKLSALEVAPADIYGGQPYTLDILLDSPAPSSFSVAITAPSALGLPTSATVALNASKRTINATAAPTATTVTHQAKAVKNGVTVTKGVKINGPVAKSVRIAGYPGTGNSVYTLFDAAKPVAVTVEIQGKSPSSTVVTVTDTIANLTSSNITVPAGMLTAVKNFPVTPAASAFVTGTITAKVGATQGRASSIAYQRGVLDTFDSPAKVFKGVPWVLKVTLKNPAPAGGVVIGLATEFVMLSQLGISTPTLIIPAGAKTKSFSFTPATNAADDEGRLIVKGSPHNAYFREIVID